MPEPYMDVLRQQFEAGEGAFLIQMRGMIWNKEAFSTLVLAMEACCRACEGQQSLERWLAKGFWYSSWCVRYWTEHPNFPRPEPQEYHQKALQRLDDLAWWFFMGHSPYEGGSGFDPL